MRASRRPRQLALDLPRHSHRGGRRLGAGRKPNGPRAGVEHERRPGFASRRPLHVTLRVRPEVGNLRGDRLHDAIRDALSAAVTRGRTDLRVVHYSVQSHHLHLIVEADRTAALTLGMQGLMIRIARALNTARGRAGRVFADRYHAVTLDTPRQVRAALAYAINNARRHAAQEDATYPRSWLDPCSSAAFLDGWRGHPRERAPADGDPVVAPRTWLLRTGWRRAGLLATHEIPGPLTWVAGPGAVDDE